MCGRAWHHRQVRAEERTQGISNVTTLIFMPLLLTSIHKTRHFAAVISGGGVWVGLDPEFGFLLLLFPLVLLVELLGGGLGFDAGLPAEKMEYEASKMVILCSVINRKSRAYLVHGGLAQRKRLSSSLEKSHLESLYSN